MRGTDGNKDARLANFQPSEAVHHGDAVNGKFLVNLRANLAHFGQRHGLVGFILKVFRGPAMRFVADETIERDDRAIPLRAHVPYQRCGINGWSHQFVQVAFGRGGHWCRGSPSAHRRQEGNLIATCNPRVPGGEFLIAGGHQRCAKSREFRVASDITLQEVAKCRPRADFSIFFREAGKFTDPAEEKDLHADSGRDGWHRKIVT